MYPFYGSIWTGFQQITQIFFFEMHDQNVRADSHLLELAVNDALIYVIKNYPLFNFDDKLPTQINDVELLLSETKF